MTTPSARIFPRVLAEAMQDEIATDSLMNWRRALLRAPGLSSATRLLGMSLSLHLNLKTGQLNPSAARLAESTAQSEEGARKQVEALCAAGWVAKTSSTKGRTSNSYRLIRHPDMDATPNGGLRLNPQRTGEVTKETEVQPPTAVGPTPSRHRLTPQREGHQPQTAVGPKRGRGIKRNLKRAEPTLVPTNWPNAEDRRYAIALWTQEGREDLVDTIDAISRKAVLWHQQREKTFKDWSKRWQQWALRELDFRAPATNGAEREMIGNKSAMAGIASALLDDGDRQ